MLQNPRLKYSYKAEFLEEDKVLMLSEQGSALLAGKLYCQVIQELQDHTLSLDELVERMEYKATMMEVYYAIETLDKKGYLTEASTGLPKEVCAYWNSQGMDINTLKKKLKENPISLDFYGSIDSKPFVSTFEEAGLRIVDEGKLKVVITDNYERQEFQYMNDIARKTGQSWMLLKPIGTELWTGPIFNHVDSQPCWECLRHRLAHNQQINTFYKAQKDTEDNADIPVIALPSTLKISAGQAAIEIIKWLYFGKNETLEDKIVSFDTKSYRTQTHQVIKRPQCGVCGDPELPFIKNSPVLKKSHNYCADYSGGYREVSHEDTLEKYKHHVSPVTGVVQKLKPYHSRKDAPVYNYLSGTYTGFKSKSLFWLNQHIRNATGGKGKTWSQAKTGAMCEAIERYSATFQGEEITLTSSFEDMGDQAIHPNALMNFSQFQFENRDQINQVCEKFHFMVPVPFDPKKEILWTPVHSLSQERVKYLPTANCYMQTPMEDDDHHLFAYPDSNGGASGNSLEEAALQGFLEVVERDSVAIWWYNRLRMPGVDLASFNEPYIFRLMEYYESIQRSLVVLDVTSDLGIPSFVAISHRIGEGNQDIVFGCGAHVDAKIALERSIIEMNQILPMADKIQDGKKERYRTPDQPIIDWLTHSTLDNQPYLKPADHLPLKTAADYQPLCEPNTYDALMHCVQAVEKEEMEPFILDMTRPDIGMNVARVFIPGMRHMWKRFAPGRLYDVPVKMGWLDEPLKEEELNPIAIFL